MMLLKILDPLLFFLLFLLLPLVAASLDLSTLCLFGSMHVGRVNGMQPIHGISASTLTHSKLHTDATNSKRGTRPPSFATSPFTAGMADTSVSVGQRILEHRNFETRQPLSRHAWPNNTCDYCWKCRKDNPEKEDFLNSL